MPTCSSGRLHRTIRTRVHTSVRVGHMTANAPPACARSVASAVATAHAVKAIAIKLGPNADAEFIANATDNNAPISVNLI